MVEGDGFYPQGGSHSYSRIHHIMDISLTSFCLDSWFLSCNCRSALWTFVLRQLSIQASTIWYGGYGVEANAGAGPQMLVYIYFF